MSLDEVRARHPGLRAAVVADARMTAALRFERCEFSSRLDAAVQVLRLMGVADAFAAQVCYRLKASLQRRGVPVLPRIAHRLAIVLGQVSIGDPVVVQPGVYLPHGQVVIDGFVEIGEGAVIAPFVTIGLRQGAFAGPRLEPGVHVGTGAKLLGSIRIGREAQIGAGAVVLADVPAGARVVGVPARPTG
jgi:serine O-acetyltransferase